MIKNYKMYFRNTGLFVLSFSLLLISSCVALATEVSRTSLCDIEGYPGETINTEITLGGTGSEERSGFWYIHYKEVAGDDDKMDITSWIAIEPKDYIIKEGENKVFIVKIKIPKDAEPGLWGVTSVEAGTEGHSAERRTYIVFKDTITGGNVYSGLLLPVAVNVLPSPDPLVPIINFIKKNIITIALSIVIIILLIKPLLRRKKRINKGN